MSVERVVGVAGHLRELSGLDVFGYLHQEHDATSVAVLLGLGAAHAASCDEEVARSMFVHMPGRHPQVCHLLPCLATSVPASMQAWHRDCQARLRCRRHPMSLGIAIQPRLAMPRVFGRVGCAVVAQVGVGCGQARAIR